MQGISELDILIIEKIQNLGEWLLPLMKFFTAWGYPPAYFIMLILLCWCWNYTLGIRLTVFIGFSGALNELLKIFFHAPRPYMVDERVIKYGRSTSFGMPSGHAQVAASFWGYVLFRSKTLVPRSIALLMIFLIGVSRIYLGVHSPAQVLAGWLIGFVLVGLLMLLEQKASQWWQAQKTAFQIFMVLDLALLLVLLALLKLYLYRDTTDFIYNTTREHTRSILSMAFLLIGTGAGGILFTKKHKVSVQLSLGKQVLKIVIALCSLAAFVPALILVEKFRDHLIQVSLLSSSSGLLMGFWISYLAPILFLKIGLFEKRNAN